MQLAAIGPSNCVQPCVLATVTNPFLITQCQRGFENARVHPDLMKYVQIHILSSALRYTRMMKWGKALHLNFHPFWSGTKLDWNTVHQKHSWGSFNIPYPPLGLNTYIWRNAFSFGKDVSRRRKEIHWQNYPAPCCQFQRRLLRLATAIGIQTWMIFF